MDAVVPINLRVIYIALYNVVVDRHIVIRVIHINISDVHVGPRTADPTAALPSMVINSAVPPIERIIQPCTDREAGPEGDKHSRRGPRTNIDIRRVIHWHINNGWLSGDNLNISRVNDYLLLRRCDQIALRIGLSPQPLH